MLRVIGNKKENITQEKLLEMSKNFTKVQIDIGTGDGNYIFKKAQENPNTFYIGIDPAAKQLEKFSKKTNRKKLPNCIYIVGSVQEMPFNIENFADEVTILFPWGTLLELVVKPTNDFFKTLTTLLKPAGTVRVSFGYENSKEPSAVEKLDLPDLSKEFIENELLPKYEECGLLRQELSAQISSTTTWGKKLNKSRKFYSITFKKE